MKTMKFSLLMIAAAMLVMNASAYLRVHVKKGYGLTPKKKIWESKMDSYVICRAGRSDGSSSLLQTSTKKNDENPNWNEVLYFGGSDFTYVRCRLMDEDSVGSDDDPGYTAPTITTIKSNGTKYTSRCWKLCHFGTSNPNSCNTGHRVEICFGYRTARLRVKVWNGRHLPDLDGPDGEYHNTDPLVQVKVRTSSNSVLKTWQTSHKGNTQYPVWEQALVYDGHHTDIHNIYARAYDAESGGDKSPFWLPRVTTVNKSGSGYCFYLCGSSHKSGGGCTNYSQGWIKLCYDYALLN